MDNQDIYTKIDWWIDSLLIRKIERYWASLQLTMLNKSNKDLIHKNLSAKKTVSL